MKRTTCVYLLFLTLVGCDQATVGSQNPSLQITVSNLRTERSERRYESLKQTQVTYNTTGIIEVKNDKGRKPGGLLYFIVSDETGSYNGGRPQLNAEFVVDGTATLSLSVSREIPDGQVIPLPPRYLFKVAGLDELEAMQLVTKEPVVPKVGDVVPPIIYLQDQPVHVVSEEKSFSARATLPIRVYGKAADSPMLVVFQMKVVSHPSKDVGHVSYPLTLVTGGHGSLDVDDFLGLNYEYGRDSNQNPRPKPKVPEYRFSVIGYQLLTGGNVTVR